MCMVLCFVLLVVVMVAVSALSPASLNSAHGFQSAIEYSSQALFFEHACYIVCLAYYYDNKSPDMEIKKRHSNNSTPPSCAVPSHLPARLPTMSVGSGFLRFVWHGTSFSDFVSLSCFLEVPLTSVIRWLTYRFALGSLPLHGVTDICALHVVPPHCLTSAHSHVILE